MPSSTRFSLKPLPPSTRMSGALHIDSCLLMRPETWESGDSELALAFADENIDDNIVILSYLVVRLPNEIPSSARFSPKPLLQPSARMLHIDLCLLTLDEAKESEISELALTFAHESVYDNIVIPFYWHIRLPNEMPSCARFSPKPLLQPSARMLHIDLCLLTLNEA